MKTITVTKFSDFVETATSELAERRIFRGVSDLRAHALLAPIGRSPRWAKLPLKSLTYQERSMLKRFKQEGLHLFQAQ